MNKIMEMDTREFKRQRVMHFFGQQGCRKQQEKTIPSAADGRKGSGYRSTQVQQI